MRAQSSRFAIGLMSGTSADGIDGVILKISDRGQCSICDTQSLPYSPLVKKQIRALIDQQIRSASEANHLHEQLAHLYAKVTLKLLASSRLNNSNHHVNVIGSHGQTINHCPNASPPFSLQIGDGQILANLTNQKVVADFRSADILVGGQGAPLAPAFHQAAFSSPTENRCIVNIGGIANVTFLPARNTRSVYGYDTGPGNTLMDHYCRQYFAQDYDQEGLLAKSGTPCESLLSQLLQDPYFQRPYPKSTGVEYFNSRWLDRYLSKNLTTAYLEHQDILATLNVLTARTIVDEVNRMPHVKQVFICGGGAHNLHLMENISKLGYVKVTSTIALGIHPQWVEAAAFAWMADRTLRNLTSTLPQVTGAKFPTVAGTIFSPV